MSEKKILKKEKKTGREEGRKEGRKGRSSLCGFLARTTIQKLPVKAIIKCHQNWEQLKARESYRGLEPQQRSL
jgi:hypothetical protein